MEGSEHHNSEGGTAVSARIPTTSSKPGLSLACSNYPRAPRAPLWRCLHPFPAGHETAFRPRPTYGLWGGREEGTHHWSRSVALLTSWSGHSSCRGSTCSSAPGTTPARSTRWSWLLLLECLPRCCSPSLLLWRSLNHNPHTHESDDARLSASPASTSSWNSPKKNWQIPRALASVYLATSTA